jgi:DNA-binding SARP family transcriptional activator
MLVARVAPPLPDGELPHQVPFDAPPGQQVVELVTPLGGLLVRRLAADLGDLGYEVAWIRPMPFEADIGSLAPLLLMALTRARGALSGDNKPVIVVVESPTAAQAEAVLDQLLAPGVPEPFGPSVVLVVNSSQNHRRRYPEMTRVYIDVPTLGNHRVRSLIPAQDGSKVPIRRLSAAAGGRLGLIDSALRSMPKIGVSELSRIAAKAHEPGALTLAVAECLLADASAAQLAALEMAGHLGYAHIRLGSLELAVAESAHHPWWVPLTNGWWQVDPAWRPALVACAARAAGVARSVCLSKLVAELAEVGAIHEGIELCLNAGWSGLAADLLADEAETLLSSGRHVALTCWLERLPTGETRSHPSLASVAAELMPAESGAEARPGPPAGDIALKDGSPTSVPPAPQKRRWFFNRSNHGPANITAVSAVPVGSVGLAAGGATVELPVIAVRSAVAPMDRGVRSAPVGPGEINADREASQDASVRVEACLLGQFELSVKGKPVQHWRGNRGRMLLAFLLLHRARPLTRDELGGAFWPDAAPEVVRNRLHVALHGLRKDLRTLCEDPIVVHGQRGFSLHPGIDLWLDIEAFDEALRSARKEQPHSQESVLKWYETALQLYRGELLEDTPFEEWALVRREQMRLQHLDALDQVARLRFAVGRYTDCLDVCQRLIPGDLCREDVHRLVMRCYTRLNQPHLAVRQYHQCERQLRDELGMAPAEATRQLYERIRRRELV